MYDPPLRPPQGSILTPHGAILNRWAELHENWYLGVFDHALSRDGVSFHV